jgi:hypothetical protein
VYPILKSSGWYLIGGLMLFGLYGNYVLHAKDTSPPSGISPEKVAEYVHAVLEADRTIYTNHVVNRMQAKGIVSAAEHWENENALPLPVGCGKRQRHPVSLDQPLARLSTQCPGDGIRAQSARHAHTTCRSSGHRRGHERPEAILSSDLCRSGHFDRLCQLPQ